MHRRALKILYSTYWSPQGWKPVESQSAPPDDLLYAKQAGVMFDPVRLSHDEQVRQLLDILPQVTPESVSSAFLASLSTRRLELRSALGSYAAMRHFPDHSHQVWHQAPNVDGTDHCCAVCRQYGRSLEHDLSILNFERHKWGGARHYQPVYAAFDLAQFLKADRPEPTSDDLAILRDLVRRIAAVPPDTTAPGLVKLTAGTFASNESERSVVIDILGYCGILRVPGHPGFSDRFVGAKDRNHDLPPQRFVDGAYPVCWWRGRYGVDREALAFWFPGLVF
jgi:hypothetical protein